MDRVRNKRPNIAVIGDLMIDHYIWGSCERISPEAPVQVVNVSKESAVLGGAGNVLTNLLSLGAEVSMFSVVGDDAHAEEMRELLNQTKIKEQLLICENGRRTTKKSRIIASNQQVIRYDDETKENISSSSSDALLEKFQSLLPTYDAVLLSDYGKGVLTTELTQNIITLANAKSTLVLVDPKGENYEKYRGATLLTPNKKEAIVASKIEIVDEQSLTKALSKFKDELALKYSIITLSEDGIGLLDEKMQVIPTVAREVFDVTGAGDTVLASLGVALASNFNIVEACEFANKAAAVVVAKVGSATVTLNEVEEYEHSLNQGKSESKIKNFNR